MLSVGIWQNRFKTAFQQGTRLFLSSPPGCKSLPAPSLCTKGGAKRNPARHRDDGLWDDALTGRGNASSVRRAPAFPKSVFAAGTAKRTAEMLRRKSALLSRDEDDENVEVSRGLSAKGAGGSDGAVSRL